MQVTTGACCETRELRCCCNRLLARVEGRAVVLKCPRCKRQAVLSLQGGAGGGEVELMFSDVTDGSKR
jgi:hypothetical protein